MQNNDNGTFTESEDDLSENSLSETDLRNMIPSRKTRNRNEQNYYGDRIQGWSDEDAGKKRKSK